MTVTLAASRMLTPDREIRPGAVAVAADGTIDRVTSEAAAVADGVLVPGFVDLQCNGAAGAHLADATPEAFAAVGRALLASGTTAYCPTLPSADPDVYPRFLDAAAQAAARPGPRVLGVHLEGPFLSPRRAGAHDPASLRPPDPDRLASLLDRHPGLVRIVTLAPELPGALECVAACVERGVVASLGHSDATEAEAEAAVDAGASMLTHAFNAMRPMHHRDVGVAGVALTDARVRCGLICDGRHVHPKLAAFVARALGPHRTVVVSDAVAAPTVDPLSGGFTLLDGALRNLSSWGVGFPDAVRSVTAGPADAIGAKQVGRLEAGAFADAVLWRDGGVAGVWVGGEAV